jgi:hypothetical protein
MTTRTTFAALLVAACGGSFEPDRRPPEEITPASCPTDGAFGLRLYGVGLGAHEGRRVRVSVVEPASIEGGAPRTFRLSSRVTGGAFEVSCPAALRENMAYPSWAVLVDVDDDGRCGGTDIGYAGQFYGWTANVEGEVPAGSWERVSAETPLRGPMPGGAADFCGGFFP